MYEYDMPREIIRYSKPALLKPLHNFMILRWRECKVPRVIPNANSIALYKTGATAVNERTTGALFENSLLEWF